MNIEIEKKSTSNLIYICVDCTRNADYRGRIFHPYANQAIEFKDSKDLLKTIDSLYDEWNFPQSSTCKRTFHGDVKRVVSGKKGEGSSMERVHDQKGQQGTFMVHVMYRQNASWQGEVIWINRKKKQYFRSALELLKLIDSAMEESEEKGKVLNLNWNYKDVQTANEYSG